MNKIEKVIYDSIKSLPWLKLMVRNVYQTFFDLMPRKAEYSVNEIIIKEGYFYGFHDTIPFSDDNRKVLANKPPFNSSMPKRSDYMKVGYFDFDGTKLADYHEVGETNAWNFHKGCRLQWLNKEDVIFNTMQDEILVSKIKNIETNHETIIDFPIDAVSANGKFASSFSYERLEKFMPGYGYAHSDVDSYLTEKAPENTGIYLVDLENNTRKMLLSLKELATLSQKEEISETAFHYVTHSEFSKDNRYLSFFHRWVGADTRKRYTQFIIFDLENNDYIVAPTGYMVSHYVWNDRNEIIVYCNYEGKDCHTLLKIPNVIESVSIAYPRLNSDGHQSFINSGVFVTDTYPDKYRMAKLYKVDISSNQSELVVSVYSPKKFQTKVFTKHIACDLHPRVSKDGQFVCFDTVKSGERSLAIMSLKQK